MNNSITSFYFHSIKVWLGLCFFSLASWSSAQQIVFVGDSIGAGYGLSSTAWVELAEINLKKSKPTLLLTNISLSGATTSSGLQNLRSYFNTGKADYVVIELGGNDGLYGLPITKLSENLKEIITLVRKKKATPLLLGISLPANYGRRRIKALESVFIDVSKDMRVPLLNLHDIIPRKERINYLQFDRIHPNEKAQPLLAEKLTEFILAAIQDK